MMPAVAGPPPSWNGSTALVIGRHIQTEGCPIKLTNWRFGKPDEAEGEA
jgi:hypothetical protein